MPRFLSLAVVAAFALLSIGGPAQAKTALSPSQAADVNQLIHDYILAHPDVVMQALQQAEDNADAAKHADAQTNLSQRQDDLLHDPNSPVLGDPDGKVTLVEFFDYRCPYCKKSAPDVSALIQSDPKLRVVMKEFPVLGPESVFASKVALVAARHGKYAAFHDAVLNFPGTLENDDTLAIARSVGLDPDAVKKEAADPAIDTIIQANLDLAKTLDIDGTPTFVIGTTIIPGVADISDLKAAIADARSKS